MWYRDDIEMVVSWISTYVFFPGVHDVFKMDSLFVDTFLACRCVWMAIDTHHTAFNADKDRCSYVESP